MEHNTSNSFLPTYVANPSRYRWMMCRDNDEIDAFIEEIPERVKRFAENRNDIEFLQFLREAWYHKASDNNLISYLDGYCKAHDIALQYEDEDIEQTPTVVALLTGYSLQVVNGDKWDPLITFKLCEQVMPRAGELMAGMLEAWQEGGDKCGCIGCTAEVAALN